MPNTEPHSGAARVPLKMEDDEGIVSDDSPGSSSSSEVESQAKARSQGDQQQQQQRQQHLQRFLKSLGLHKAASGAPGSGNEAKSAPGRVFGKDLVRYLRETNNEIPSVMRICSECIERHGMIDGIYRLSGIASNIRALKLCFEEATEEESLTLLDPKDPSIRQDIHSISSLLKLYCRELPNPLCTFQLYERFLKAAKVAEEFRLGALRQVVQELPTEHYRTLSFLMHHLHLVSKHGTATGMTAKNLAIVWAPNLLREKPSALALPNLGDAQSQNLQDIALQATCTEFLIDYCALLFSEKLTSESSATRTFDLGIELNPSASKEVDIDSAIAAKEGPQQPQSLDPGLLQNAKPSRRPRARATSMRSRPKSLALPSAPVGRISCSDSPSPADPPTSKSRIHTVIQLERSRSSAHLLTSNQASRTSLISFFQGLNRRRKESSASSSGLAQAKGKKSKMVHSHTSAALPVQDIPDPDSTTSFLREGDAFAKERRRRRRLLRAAKSSECLRPALNRVQFAPSSDELHAADPGAEVKPAQSESSLAVVRPPPGGAGSSSSSSEQGSTTDIHGEVHHLQLSFESEENEMKMMNCTVDSSEEPVCAGGHSSSFSKASNSANPGQSQKRVKLRDKWRKRFASPASSKEKEESESGHSSLKSRVASVLIYPITKAGGGKASSSTSSSSHKEKKNVYSCKVELRKENNDSAPEQFVPPHRLRRHKSYCGDIDIDSVKQKVEEEMKKVKLPDVSSLTFSDSKSSSRIKSVESKDPEVAAVSRVNASSSQADEEDEEPSLVTEISAAWNLKKSQMETTPSLLAFDNQAYGGYSLPPVPLKHQQDSGFEESTSGSSPSHSPTGEDSKPANSDEDYENVSPGHYQNVEEPLGLNNYQSGRSPDRPSRHPSSGTSEEETYQNIEPRRNQAKKAPKKQTWMESGITTYQNVSFASAPSPSSPPPPRLPEKRSKDCDEAGGAVYENYDFGRYTTYQNLVLKQPPSKARARSTGRMADDEVYAQVRFLRQSVQEVNALLEDKEQQQQKQKEHHPARPARSQRSSSVCGKAPTSSARCLPVAPSEERRLHFQELLSKFSETPSAPRESSSERRKMSLPCQPSMAQQRQKVLPSVAGASRGQCITRRTSSTKGLISEWRRKEQQEQCHSLTGAFIGQ